MLMRPCDDPRLLEGLRHACGPLFIDALENPDVIAKVATSVLEQILNGEKPFQNAFMSGDLSAQGNFKALRNFDAVFRFS